MNRTLAPIIFLAISIVYGLFFYPSIQQSSSDFLLERSEDSQKNLGLLTLLKGTIEAAKHIPGVQILAGRAEPLEDIVDMLWYSALFSYIFNQILNLYAATDLFFILSIIILIIYLFLRIIYKLYFRHTHSTIYRLLEGILYHPIIITIYRGSLLFAIVLPVYIFSSMKFYQYYYKEFVLPEYQAITSIFADIEMVDKAVSKEPGKILQEGTNGFNGLWDKVSNFFSTTKAYAQAYGQGFLRLVSTDGRQKLQSYALNSLTLFILYFVVFPLALWFVLRSIFSKNEQQELKYPASQITDN